MLDFQDCFIIFVACSRDAVAAHAIHLTKEVAVHRVCFFHSTTNIRLLRQLPLFANEHQTDLRMNPKNFRYILETLYLYMTKQIEIDGKEVASKLIDCSQENFLYIFDAMPDKDKCVVDKPVINWIGGIKLDMIGFVYAYVFGENKEENKEENKKTAKYKQLFLFNGEPIKKLSDNRERANNYVDKWIKIIKQCIEIGNKKQTKRNR